MAEKAAKLKEAIKVYNADIDAECKRVFAEQRLKEEEAKANKEKEDIASSD